MKEAHAAKQRGKWLPLLIPMVLVATWLVIAAIGGPYFGRISDVATTDLSSFLPKSAESTKVNDQLSSFSDSKSIPLIVVFDGKGTVLSAAQTSKITASTAAMQDINGVSGLINPPIIADDSKAAFFIVPLQNDGDFEQIFKDVRTALDGQKFGVAYKLTGPASMSHDLQGAFAGIDGTLLFAALIVVFVILLVVYRSPILPILVLLVSIAALAAAILVVWHMATAGIIELNGQVQGILFILVIGAATDYSLLYISRYREELTHHAQPWQAAVAALKASFEPILAAGGTVTAGLLCLLLSDLGSNKALGPVGGIGVVMAIAAALTFLPALLIPFGRVAFWPKQPVRVPNQTHDHYMQNHRIWAKVGTFVGSYPRQIWTILGGILLLLCIGVFQLRADGVAQSSLVLGHSEARDGQVILDAHFPSGSGSPTYILTDANAFEKAITILDKDEGVDSVVAVAINSKSGTIPVGATRNRIEAKLLAKAEAARQQQLKELRANIETEYAGYSSQVIDRAYAAALPQIPTADSVAKAVNPFGDAAVKVVNGGILLQATLTSSPGSVEARNTVTRLRSSFAGLEQTVLVGGVSAIQEDTNAASTRDLRVILPLILAAITIILMLLLRAIVAPLVLLLTTVLSFGATLGVSALLFNYVWRFPGADPSVVIFGFVFLVALGIDYNIFLMTRVREETKKLGVRRGTIKGLVVTGGVITSAGIVLASTFAALSVIPILFLAQIAFIVAFGVLLDTLIVRSLIVPALTIDIDKPMWWPSHLSRK